MTKKRRRKRPAPLRPAETSAPAAPAAPPAGRPRTTLPRGDRRPASRTRATERPAPTRRPRTAEERRAAAAHWVHPPVAVTAARGLWAVGMSPVLVISSFLAALALWLVFTAYGANLARAPGWMALFEALPPVHSLFLDVLAVATVFRDSVALGVVGLAGLLAIRAALLAFWLSLIMERLQGTAETEAAQGDGWTRSVSRALSRTVRNLGPMVAMEAGFFALAMATAVAAVAFALGLLAGMAGLVGGLYFFVYVPVIIAVEGAGVREAARLSYRAARFPGPRHMVATFSYVALVLFVYAFVPPNRVAAATPDAVTWLLVLFMSFVHVCALATFSYRWLLIRDRVLAAAGEGSGRRPVRTAASLH